MDSCIHLSCGDSIVRRTSSILLGLSVPFWAAGCGEPTTVVDEPVAVLHFAVAESANQAAATVHIDVSYRRSEGENVLLHESRIDLARLGQGEISVELELTLCLGDPTHLGGTGVCTVDVDITLLDESDLVLDRETIGPLMLAIGEATTAPEVTLEKPPPPVDSVYVSPDSSDVLIGGLSAYSAQVFDEEGNELTGRIVTWSTGEPGVATVDGSGVVTGVGEGVTTVTATSEGVSDGAIVVVFPKVVVDGLSVATGMTHACAISSGTTYCWGANEKGQLGEGTTEERLSPVAVVGGLEFEALTSGTRYTCGLTSNGSAHCWGYNHSGQLGTGNRVDQAFPTPVSGGIRFVHLTAGSSHTCGLAADSLAYCWGRNNWGQLGDGSTTDEFVPVSVAQGMRFQSISAGWYHTCGINPDGVTVCWGYNPFGALGNGSTVSSSTPVPVSGGLEFTSVSAGQHNTCALTAAGNAYCWGWNARGQAGDGTTTQRNSPVAVAGGLTFQSLNVGSNSCGISTDGVPYCWGSNFLGQVGDGTLVDRLTPVAIGTAGSFSEISVGNGANDTYATCALAEDGLVSCWGTGQFGLNEPIYRSTPVPVSGGQSFTSLALGDDHSCGVEASGTVYCWGWNDRGQLGDGTRIPKATPTRISTALTFSSVCAEFKRTCGIATGGDAYCWGGVPSLVGGGLTFSELAMTWAATCGISDTNAAYCWGNNQYGQLGDGTTVSRGAPTPVSGGLNFNSISGGGGGGHVCAVSETDGVFCWGRNSNGQLGDGTSIQRLTPIQPVGGTEFVEVSAGGLYSCALTAAGAAYCWGSNTNGQFGNGTRTESLVPVAAASGLSLSSISAGSYIHACGLTDSGEAYCWGRNEHGQLGSGNTIDSTVPVPVTGGLTFSLIVAYRSRTCGLTASGAAYCWGRGTNGQLGDGTAGYSLVPRVIPLY
jgi:alpha-tubulin suppressor-like RCC1 family protein